MTVLDFEVALRDERLVPLTQVVALSALDGNFSPFDCDPLMMSHIYRAALAPTTCAADATDLACVCTAVFSDICVGAGVPPNIDNDGRLTPTFISRSTDRNGYLAERRLFLQLENRRRMASNIISSSS